MKSPIPAAESAEQVPILYQNPFGDGKLSLRVPSQGSPFRSETTRIATLSSRQDSPVSIDLSKNSPGDASSDNLHSIGLRDRPVVTKRADAGLAPSGFRKQSSNEIGADFPGGAGHQQLH